MRRSAWYRRAVLAILILALPVVLSACFFFRGTLTIHNESSHDLDFVQWANDWSETIEFGDDLVWDTYLVADTPGILHGSSSTRKTFSGTDFIYFCFADQSSNELRRTVEQVTVGGFDDASFVFTDSTPSIALSSSPFMRNERRLTQNAPAPTAGGNE